MSSWNRIERGSGEPLVLLHGAGGTARNWLPVMDRLAVDRRVIALDFPGFGRTPFPDDAVFGMDWAMGELAAELRRLGIDGPVDLAGNSMGGWFALEAAKRGMARSVVALAPAGLWRRGMPGLLYTQFHSMLAGSMLTRGPGAAVLRIPPVRYAGLAVVASRPWRISAAEGIRMVRDLDRSERALRIAVSHARGLRFEGGQDIDAPVTVAFGTRDLMLPSGVSQHRDQLPAHTRWVRLPGCGHVPMSDDPDLVAGTILDGIARPAAREASA
ncbi:MULTISPECIES: alpha/beta hydrolase [unclassified Nocardia]|uniref:alpha/beta fold hydrolase n=1 Tax=unclassified Nocardia TaxID=2637762 RepID=UPI0024A83952|nr:MULTISPECIES: alpha/beta hydrolase [unclassified Nocardia]